MDLPLMAWLVGCGGGCRFGERAGAEPPAVARESGGDEYAKQGARHGDGGEHADDDADEEGEGEAGDDGGAGVVAEEVEDDGGDHGGDVGVPDRGPGVVEAELDG